MLFTIAKAVARCLGNFSRKIVPKKLKKSPNLVTLKFTQPMLVVHCGSIIQISLTHSAAHLYYFWVWVTLGPKTPSTFFETPVRVFRPKRCFGPSIKVKVNEIEKDILSPSWKDHLSTRLETGHTLIDRQTGHNRQICFRFLVCFCFNPVFVEIWVVAFASNEGR